MWRLPAFGRFRREAPPRKCKMLPGFVIGNHEPHAQFLARHPEFKLTASVPAVTSSAVFQQSLFREARNLYQPETGEYWKNELPGDCEDECLWFLTESAEAGIDVSDYWIALCETERGEAHAVLLVTQSEETLVIDFRLTDPFLPLGHAAFNGYRWTGMAKPTVNRWFTCMKRRVR